MLTLAYDTSSKTVSVAILRDENIIYDVVINIALNHSEVLLPAIDQACVCTRNDISDFDLFACTQGPGSFTGLRIGASTLKGFMLATGKPAVGISSLEALAMNAGTTSKIICSVMDAGRGQVYTAYFQTDENSFLRRMSEDTVVNPSLIKYHQNEDIVFVGDGAVKYADMIKKNNKDKIPILSGLQTFIRASSVGILALEKYRRKEFLDADKFVPVYLRSADVTLGK